MNQQENNEVFAFSYSAKEQAEIKRIREKYTTGAESGEDKMAQLRRLDAGVTKKGSAVSLVIGILSALILGVGMCCCMVWDMYLLGVPVGVVGIVGTALAYPVYSIITKKEREKIAPEILRLTDELMK